MGSGASAASLQEVNEEALIKAGVDLYKADPEKYERVISEIKFNSRATRPLFPEGIIVADIPPIPAEEVEDFKVKNVSSAYLHSDDPEFNARLKPLSTSRSIQY
mmetsp:Transcript_4631/g.7573  ORF Transcript_4631/g.7573 Transcript_4631/m.7573 type:complete len:104 (-) Transcript_4631:822-1133(-)